MDRLQATSKDYNGAGAHSSSLHELSAEGDARDDVAGPLPMVVVRDWSLISEQSLNAVWELALAGWEEEWDWRLLSLARWRAIVEGCVAAAR